VQRARDILADMVKRQLLIKISEQQRGPSVEYGPGLKFPGKLESKAKATPTRPASPRKKPGSHAGSSATLPLFPEPGRKRTRGEN
jgi:ATP-dependent DNA helicase RecG